MVWWTLLLCSIPVSFGCSDLSFARFSQLSAASFDDRDFGSGTCLGQLKSISSSSVGSLAGDLCTQRDVYSSSLEAHFDQSFARFYLLSTASSDACDIGSGTFQGEPQSRSFSSAGQRAGVLGWPDGVPAFGPVICFLHWYRDVDADVSAYVQPWHSWTNTWFHVVARVGEALNPGPSAFCIGVANPSGLRCKEEVCLDHPVGILNLCETQLSYVTQASCRRRLQALAANAGRHLRTIFGSPVVTRANSEWAGSWVWGSCFVGFSMSTGSIVLASSRMDFWPGIGFTTLCRASFVAQCGCLWVPSVTHLASGQAEDSFIVAKHYN